MRTQLLLQRLDATLIQPPELRMGMQAVPRLDGGDLTLEIDALAEVQELFDDSPRGRPCGTGILFRRAGRKSDERGGCLG